VIRAHQPGSEPIDIPETIPNPVARGRLAQMAFEALLFVQDPQR
jgi:hypothetical protein